MSRDTDVIDVVIDVTDGVVLRQVFTNLTCFKLVLFLTGLELSWSNRLNVIIELMNSQNVALKLLYQSSKKKRSDL